MKISIFAKIFMGYVFIILSLSAFILFFSFRITRSHYIKNITTEMSNLGIILRTEVLPILESKNLDRLDPLIKELGEKTHTRITIINPEGDVLADSDKDPRTMENHKARPEIAQALQGSQGKALRFSSTLQEEMLYVALPVEKQDRVLGVVRMSLYLKDINVLLATLKGNILLPMAGLVIAGSVVAALFISRNLARPIMKLASASRKVATGDFDVKVAFQTNGELRDLQDSFNLMTQEVKKLFTELNRHKEYLNSIIRSIPEGLLVIDKDGRISLGNEGLKSIIRRDDLSGKKYSEVITEPDLAEFIRNCRAEKTNASRELILGNRFFQAVARFTPTDEELILTIHEITELKKMEQIKKDLVINLSHELRTPLTAIKGFAETLEEKADQEQKHHLDIIKRHTERLIKIAEDLLVLARLETEESEPEMTEVDLISIIQNVLHIMEPKLKKKNLQMKFERQKKLPPSIGDAAELERLFTNLIENAIQYTDRGHINIEIRTEDGHTLIIVKDSGIGIAPEHLSRIFERFYVVDKSRSRELGGAGLGLSIVKTIIQRHQGTIDIDSIPGEGTKVTVALPLRPA